MPADRPAARTDESAPVETGPLAGAPSIPALAEAAAARFANDEAVVDGQVRLTFAQLFEQSSQVTRAMLALGVEKGDRVALWAPNSARWIVVALGILGAGAVLVPLNTRFKGPEAADILGTAEARVLISVDQALGTSYLDMLRRDGGYLPSLQHVVVLGETGGTPAPVVGTPVMGWDEMLAGSAGVPEEAAAARRATIGRHDLSDLIFTSGTTGRPKGVMLTHGQSLAVYDAWTDTVGLTQDDRMLVAYPFFHCAGYKSGWLSCLLRGATVLPVAVFDPDRILELVGRERVSVLPGTPTMLQDVLDHPGRDDFDLSALRLTVTGAAVVPVELIKRLRAEMTFRTIITGYGLTETCGTVAMCRHDDDPETIANWSGRAIPNTELAVVDDDGTEVERGTPGEVVTRGYHVTTGYFHDPGATSATIDADGWLHTGDIGVMDERGYVRITDRKKDMFIVGGFNAYPAEIEGALLRHAGVSQACVVGVPDARMGEVGAAYLVPRPGVELDPDEIASWSRTQMANFKVPRHVVVVDRLPVNPTGKVLKFEVRDRAIHELDLDGGAGGGGA